MSRVALSGAVPSRERCVLHVRPLPVVEGWRAGIE